MSRLYLPAKASLPYHRIGHSLCPALKKYNFNVIHEILNHMYLKQQPKKKVKSRWFRSLQE